MNDNASSDGYCSWKYSILVYYACSFPMCSLRLRLSVRISKKPLRKQCLSLKQWTSCYVCERELMVIALATIIKFVACTFFSTYFDMEQCLRMQREGPLSVTFLFSTQQKFAMPNYI